MTAPAQSKAKSGKRPETFDHLRSSKKPVSRKVPVCLDDEAVFAVAQAREAVEEAKLTNHGAVSAELQDRLATAEAALEEATVYFKFRSIGRKRYEELIAMAPPSDELIEDHKNRELPEPAYDAEVLAPILIAEACYEPVMTPEQVQELLDEWNINETLPLWTAALEVCTANRISQLGKGSG